jgi:hypothetical protein
LAANLLKLLGQKFIALSAIKYLAGTKGKPKVPMAQNIFINNTKDK